MGEGAHRIAWEDLSYGIHRMDGLDAADRGLLRAAGLDARRHDLARGCLSRSGAGRRAADSDHARRSPVRLAGAGG
ncbi:hypothetical protein chiPu_0032939, partial [Chiloscyllium punctatum]|nr:hypothetical protein [Chiloscyllium punctatum]